MYRVFRFDVEKTIQAVAFLLRREPHRCMNYMRLLKILYIAEREILAESGKPLTGSPVVAVPRGLLLEDVHELIRSQHIDTPRWSVYFRVENYRLAMVADPGVGKLSRFVTAKLEEVARRHENDDEWTLAQITRKFPEWVASNPGDSSKRIRLEAILKAMGQQDRLQSIVEGVRDDKLAREFFRGKASASERA